jgi:3-oxoadipate enol-lactonase
MAVLRLADAEIDYQLCGSGPPLLLLHGLGSSQRDWQYQVPELGRHFQVITCDMRGHGASSRRHQEYSIELFARDAAEILRSLGLAPVGVAGISMGGMIGLELALSFPQLVKRLVVCNAGPRLRFDRPREKIELAARKFLLHFMGMGAVGRKLAWEMFPEPEQEEFRRLVMERWRENDRSCYRRALEAVLKYDAEGRLENLRCPLLVIRGELDQTPMDIDPQKVRLPSGSRRVVVRGSRHATCIDRAGEFNRLLIEFFAEQNPQQKGDGA